MLTNFLNPDSIYKIWNYSDADHKVFLDKFFTLRFLNESQKAIAMKNAQHIIENIRNSGVAYNKNQLMLHMIPEVSISDEDLSQQIKTVYSIYERFMLKRLEITNGENLMVYQHLALKSIENSAISNKDYRFNFDKLEIWHKYNIFENNEFLRKEILILNSASELEFVHKNYAEFLVSQYLIDNIYLENSEVNDSEAEHRLKVFFDRLTDEIDTNIGDFIVDYVDIHGNNLRFNDQMRDVTKTKFFNYFFETLIYDNATFMKINKAIGVDKDLLGVMWGINDSETYISFLTIQKTYFHSDFEEFKKDYDELKLIVAKYFPNSKDYEKLLYGENQRGNFLFESWSQKSDKFKEFFLTISNVSLSIEDLNDSDTFLKFYKSIENLLTHDEKLELLVKNIFKILSKHIENASEFKEFWTTIEKEFDIHEISVILRNKRKRIDSHNMFHILFSKKNYVKEVIKEYENYVPYEQVITELSEFSTDLYSNIGYGIRNVMATDELFKIIWNFLEKYSNIEVRKIILRIFLDIPNNKLIILKRKHKATIEFALEQHRIYFS